MSSVATEEMSAGATEEMSSVATEEMPSVATEEQGHYFDPNLISVSYTHLTLPTNREV